MSRAENRMRKAALKRIEKSKKIPKEDKEKVLAAVSCLDLNALSSDPARLMALLHNPGKLMDFVDETKVDSETAALFEDGSSNPEAAPENKTSVAPDQEL